MNPDPYMGVYAEEWANIRSQIVTFSNDNRKSN